MKKLIITAFILLTIGNLPIYAYTTFPLENAKWTEVELREDENWRDTIYYTHFFEGDTVIDNVKRSKIYTTYHANPTNKHLDGFIHIEGKQVFFRLPQEGASFPFCIANEEDYLLYDFSLEAGDYLHWCGEDSYLIDVVDSVEIGGYKHKRYISNHSVFRNPYCIEGIGNISGLFSSIHSIPTSISYQGTRIICFMQNNELMYLDPDFTDCPSILTIKQLQTEPHIITTFFDVLTQTLNIVSQYPLLKIELFDTQGRMVRKKEYNNELKFLLDCSIWASGIYFIKIIDGNGYEYVEKIIIK
ncbi:hypothetical protein FACS189413_07860 [Bacteroidia bacterium]|nr:hypothetical protein FACS189413_07860 [Bacteroidia bacterium]